MSSETMLERMAEAIRSEVWKDVPSDRIYERMAKAALEAIREPSSQLINAGWEEAVSNEGVFPELVWPAMVDFILNESPAPTVTD